jgi:glycosyltransferase involved in cell wall biosynthesis
MMIPDLPMGGAEIFFVRLARALAKKHHVHVFLGLRTSTHPEVLKQLDDIAVSHTPLSSPIQYRFFYKFALLCAPPASRFHLVDLVRSWVLRRLHRRFHFDVVNPHLLVSERQACLAFQHVALPIIGTDHGDYHWVLEDPEQRNYFSPVLERSDGLICLSSANMDSAMRYPRRDNFSYFKIYNGLDREYAKQEGNHEPRDLEPFRFVMVARGTEEKGWSEAIAAFRMLRQRRPSTPVELHLVGSGSHLEKLRDTPDISVISGLVFHGYQSDPGPFVATAHAGLLPTYLPSESLPNSIVEYLAAGKPVIATPAGGIVEMLESQAGPAGLIVQQTPGGKANVAELSQLMETMVTDRALWRALQERTASAFAKFSMDACVTRYEEAFRSLQKDA